MYRLLDLDIDTSSTTKVCWNDLTADLQAAVNHAIATMALQREPGDRIAIGIDTINNRMIAKIITEEEYRAAATDRQ